MELITSLTEIRNDAAAECRWWNALIPAERRALLEAARRSNEFVGVDWLDICEVNRTRILDAAFAIQSWLRATPTSL